MVATVSRWELGALHAGQGCGCHEACLLLQAAFSEQMHLLCQGWPRCLLAIATFATFCSPFPTRSPPQPEGPSWSVEGNVVTWEGWQFHLGFSWREGLIINDLKARRRCACCLCCVTCRALFGLHGKVVGCGV